MGIRDGDPAVLQALVNRRGAAVLAYCEQACAPSLALDAAADAFTRFRATVLAAERPGDINPEGALLSATRHAAAARTPRPPAAPSAGGLGRLLAGGTPTDRLPDVPMLLALRADGEITAEDEEVLEALLDASPVARAIEERFSGAEEAYRAAPRQSLPEPVTDQIVATMGALAAAPTNGAPAPAPELDPLPPPPRFVRDDYEDEDEEGAEPHAEEPVEPAPPPAETDGAPEMAEPPEVEAPVDVSTPDAVDPFADELEAPAEPASPDEPAAVDPFAAELADESVPEDEELVASDAEPELAEDELSPPEALAAAEVEVPQDDGGATIEWEPADEDAVSVDEALPEGAEIAAARGEEPDPSGTVEWSVPEDEGPEVEHEIAAARLHEDDQEGDAAHLQSASGALPEEDVSALETPPAPPAAAPDPPPHRHHHGLPGRAALVPAGAVVTIAAIGALVASGVFGGNDPSPTVDTGIVPERALQAVPEGEAATIVDDLRSAAADARRRRLADQRQQLASSAPPPAAEPETTTTTPADEPAEEETPTPPTAEEDEAPTETNPGAGGTSAEDATGGGTESP